MSSIDQNTDVRQLVRWLGVEGARAGLLQSKRMTLDSLRKLGQSLKLNLPEKLTRQQLIDELVKVASKRIDKSIDELFSMEQEALMDYFEHVEVEPAELLDILKELDLTPRRREGRRSLLEFAARELSETGRFMRIAGKSDSSKGAGKITSSNESVTLQPKRA